MKYKLIKKYPNSPELNDDVESNNIDPFGFEYYCKDAREFFTSDEIENYPEFWEKVEENDFQIISFRRTDPNDVDISGFRYILDKNSIFYAENNCYIRFSLVSMLHKDSCVDSGDFIIESIKRLSDNEVFTIGDRIDHFYFNIKEFKISGNSIQVILGRDDTVRSVGLKLNSLKKKTPIITTEDNVELFVGDTYCYIWVFDNSLQGESINTLYFGGIIDAHFKSVCDGVKIFSTEQAAKDYLRTITVLFITEDGVELFEGDKFWHVDTYFGIGQGIIMNPFVKLKGYHEFSTREKAQKYVDLYKPQYSMKDILDSSENFWNSTILLDLNKLKSKK